MTKYTCTNCGAEITVETTRDDAVEAKDKAIHNTFKEMHDILSRHDFKSNIGAYDSWTEALEKESLAKIAEGVIHGSTNKFDVKFKSYLDMSLNSIRREKAEKEGWAFDITHDRAWCGKCFKEIEEAFMSNPLVAIPFIDHAGYLRNKDGTRFNRMLWRLHQKYKSDDNK